MPCPVTEEMAKTGVMRSDAMLSAAASTWLICICMQCSIVGVNDTGGKVGVEGLGITEHQWGRSLHLAHLHACSFVLWGSTTPTNDRRYEWEGGG